MNISHTFNRVFHKRKAKSLRLQLDELIKKIKKQRGEILYYYDPKKCSESDYIVEHRNEKFDSLYREASEVAWQIIDEDERASAIKPIFK